MADLSDSRVEGLDGLPIRATLRRAFAVFRRQAGRFLLLAVLAALPIYAWLLSGGSPGVSSPSLWLVSAQDYLVSVIIQGIAAVLTIGAMRGRPAGLVQAGAACLRRLGPLMAVAVVLSLPGLVRLVVLLGLDLELPRWWGLVFTLFELLVVAIWLPAVPACVWEGLSARESLHRGFSLAAGYRGEVIALLIIVKGMAVATLAVLRSSLLLSTQPGSPVDPGFVLLLDQLAQALWLVIADILAAVVYCTLRTIKDGGSADMVD